jgi:hypothetical protein
MNTWSTRQVGPPFLDSHIEAAVNQSYMHWRVPTTMLSAEGGTRRGAGGSRAAAALPLYCMLWRNHNSPWPEGSGQEGGPPAGRLCRRPHRPQPTNAARPGATQPNVHPHGRKRRQGSSLRV